MFKILHWLLLYLIFFSEVQCNIQRRIDFARIVGGNASTIENFPHIVSIRLANAHACGGSIISTQYVLTAAHCRVSDNLKLYSVVAGATYNKYDGVIFNVETFVIHELYDNNTLINDIALIKIKGSFDISTKVQPIQLPSPSLRLQSGEMLTITGWGDTKLHILDILLRTLKNRRNRNFTFIHKALALQKASVPFVSFERCIESFQSTGQIISNDAFCAGMPGVDACQGDSGGGVILRGQLVGIVSWGLGCADPKYFGIYTNIMRYLDWIKEHMV